MTKKMNELYESIILASMIDYVCAEKPALRPIIESADATQKRTLILNFLEENNPEHRLMCSKIQKTVKQNKGATKHIKDVVRMLREYVEVSDTERKLGEVMTPISLVEEMLDTLPYEVWTNPDLKWLDPCNGVGTFPSVIIQRLMKGLTEWQPNEELRYQHIMENMLYVSELQQKNLFLYLYAFDPDNKYDPNVFCGSYLSEDFDKHMKDIWGVEKFDVVVMNPPYNSDRNTKVSTLWDKFVVKTTNQLIEGGHLVAVHPDTWRGNGKNFNNVKTILKSKQITYLEIHDSDDGVKNFGAKTPYDFYCLHNVPNTMFTKIKCADGTIERADISKMQFIPNGMYKEFEKLFTDKKEERVNILANSSYHTQKEYTSKEETEEFKYPIVYVTYKDGSINRMYSSTNKKGHFGIPKVIWSNGSASTPIVDESGKYGLTQFAYAIVDDIENLPFIQKALLNPDFKKLMSFSDGITGVGKGSVYNRKAIALFRKDFWKEYQY